MRCDILNYFNAHRIRDAKTTQAFPVKYSNCANVIANAKLFYSVLKQNILKPLAESGDYPITKLLIHLEYYC